MKVSLTEAISEAEIKVVKTFFNCFFYDLSQYDDKIGINAYGFPFWIPSGLPGPTTGEECADFNWWVRDKAYLYLIWVDNTPAGFITILADKELLVPEVDYEVLDFYIVPKYRRSSVGRKAALAAFELYQGNWQVFQLEGNMPARHFWQRIITEYTNNHFENLDEGTQQRFNNTEVRIN